MKNLHSWLTGISGLLFVIVFLVAHKCIRDMVPMTKVVVLGDQLRTLSIDELKSVNQSYQEFYRIEDRISNRLTAIRIVSISGFFLTVLIGVTRKALPDKP